MLANALTVEELRVGETGTSRFVVKDGVSPRGVQLSLSDFGESAFWSFEGDVRGLAWGLVGEEIAAAGRLPSDGTGEGEEGDSILRS